MMRHKKTFKTFSALSFDGKAVPGESQPLPGDSPRRLISESARHLNGHQHGAAEEAVTQAEGPAPAGHWQGTEGGPAPQRAREPGLDVVANAEAFRAMLLQRYQAPYEVAAPYRHWGINE